MRTKHLVLATCRAAGSIFRAMYVGRDVLDKKSNTGRLAHDLTHVADFNRSGSKYLRPVNSPVPGKIDVYAVLEAFDVRCPARQHAIKKLLCAGLRGKGGESQDLEEAADAVSRAVQMQGGRDCKR